MKLRQPESETFRTHDSQTAWHDVGNDGHYAEYDMHTGDIHFWKAFLLGLAISWTVILAVFFVSAYVHADPLQFRTDQYVPPQIVQPLTIQPGCQK